MRTTIRILISVTAILLLPVCSVANTVVNVSATGTDRDAAIEAALGKALTEALGSQVFSVTAMNGDQFHSLSTAVTSGRVENYQVLEERETFEGVHVRLRVDLADKDMAQLVPEEIKTWSQRIEHARSWDRAQRSVGEYRAILDEFLVGPRHQLNAGYAIILRSYDVEAVDENRISGNIYVDITVNQSWWNIYYRLVQALTPQGNQVIKEGRLKVARDTAGVDLRSSHRVDKSLRYDLAHALPVRLSVGKKVASFILYKNALLVSARPMTEDSARTDYHRLQAARGEISLTKGNVIRGNAEVDKHKSALDCGVVEQGGSAVYCGKRFTVKIPFEAANESEVIETMQRGVRAELSLYGNSCEHDCDLFNNDSEEQPDTTELLEQMILKLMQ